MALTLILGDQLFETPANKDHTILMVEEPILAQAFLYHKLRILHCFVSMREYADSLKNKGFKVLYFTFDQGLTLEDCILKHIGKSKTLFLYEPADSAVEARLTTFCAREEIQLNLTQSPQFLCSKDEFKHYLKGTKKPFMKTFYERERKRLNLLMDPDGKPAGGKYSFDSENRKKTPKGYIEPSLPKLKKSKHEDAVIEIIESFFKNNKGELGPLWVPYTRETAVQWLNDFLKNRFHEFGPFEDAIGENLTTLNHSILSPLINIGLLTPKEVVEKAVHYAAVNQVPMASLEGFVRQIVGWREFIRGIHTEFGARQAKENFFKHTKKLKPCWYNGTTGIPPLDDCIKKVNRLAYNHHIERLMIIGNLMKLCEVHPNEVHRWFMEMYLDSYLWVMGPNVYGMTQMSDGGIFATKPYISGSNYILKMSDYKKGAWCDYWDGLYWRFIDRNRAFFIKNPRLSMMVHLYDKMPKAKKDALQKHAKVFLDRVVTDSETEAQPGNLSRKS